MASHLVTRESDEWIPKCNTWKSHNWDKVYNSRKGFLPCWISFPSLFMFCRWDTETSNESMVPKDHKWNENDKKNLSNKFHVNEFLGGRIYKWSRENNRIKKTGYKSIIGQLNNLYKIYFIYSSCHLFTQLKVVQNVRPFAPTMLIILANKWWTIDSIRYVIHHLQILLQITD